MKLARDSFFSFHCTLFPFSKGPIVRSRRSVLLRSSEKNIRSLQNLLLTNIEHMLYYLIERKFYLKEGSIMQTLYYSTSNFIRYTGNVIDLCEYREKLSRVTEGTSARPAPVEETSGAPARRRTRRHAVLSSLDIFTSIALLVMTITVMCKFFI